MNWHPSIRLRLTLSYAGLSVLTAAALLALNYGLLYNSLYGSLGLLPLANAPSVVYLNIGSASAKENLLASEAAFRDQLRTQTLVHTAETSARPTSASAA